MSKLTKDCRVFVIADNHKMRKGTLKGIYEGVNTAVVDFDDNNEVFEKVKLDSIGILEEPTEPIYEEPTESVLTEKSEITITPIEFMNITSKIIADMARDHNHPCEFIGACAVILGKIHEALFLEDPENE